MLATDPEATLLYEIVERHYRVSSRRASGWRRAGNGSTLRRLATSMCFVQLENSVEVTKMTIKQAVVFALIACSIPQLGYAQGGSLEGAWRVSEFVVTGGANPGTNRSPQPGLFLFTDRHYSIVTVNSTAPRKEVAAAANPAQLTDAEKLARYEAWGPFTANSGTYDVSGTTLTTRPLVAKNPNAMGTSTAWELKIEGNTLTLVQRSGANQPASETRITLTRIE